MNIFLRGSGTCGRGKRRGKPRPPPLTSRRVTAAPPRANWVNRAGHKGGPAPPRAPPPPRADPPSPTRPAEMGGGGEGATPPRSLPVVLLVLAGVDLGTFGELLRAAAHLRGVLHGGAAKSGERRRPARGRKWRRKRSGHRLRRLYIAAKAANQRRPGDAAAPPCGGGGATRALRWPPPWACCRCRRGCAPSCWTWRAPPPPSPSCRCAAPGGGDWGFGVGGVRGFG